jgi:hypothetical protein
LITHSRIHTYTHTHTHSLTHPLTLSHTHTHTHSHSLTLTHSHTHTLSLSCSLSFAHTHSVHSLWHTHSTHTLYAAHEQDLSPAPWHTRTLTLSTCPRSEDHARIRTTPTPSLLTCSLVTGNEYVKSEGMSDLRKQQTTTLNKQQATTRRLTQSNTGSKWFQLLCCIWTLGLTLIRKVFEGQPNIPPKWRFHLRKQPWSVALRPRIQLWGFWTNHVKCETQASNGWLTC